MMNTNRVNYGMIYHDSFDFSLYLILTNLWK